VSSKQRPSETLSAIYPLWPTLSPSTLFRSSSERIRLFFSADFHEPQAFFACFICLLSAVLSAVFEMAFFCYPINLNDYTFINQIAPITENIRKKSLKSSIIMICIALTL
jgi:hypothetical protein